MPSKRSFTISSPFTEKFNPTWEMWKQYRWVEHKFVYKSPISEQAALNMLVDLSEGDEDHAIRIINQSMSRGWMGFFKLHNPKKDKKDGQSSDNGKSLPGGTKTISIDKGKAAHTKRYGGGEQS